MGRREFEIKVKVIAHSNLTLDEVVQQIMKGEQSVNANSTVRFHFEFPKNLSELFEVREIMES
jgi:hypothetical protein